MSRLVYVNGAVVPESEAKVSIFDRGMLFGDGVYEVTAVAHGKLVDFDAHMARLSGSLGHLRIPEPLTRDRWLELHRRLVAENRIEHGLVYVQVTRGDVSDRDFLSPDGLEPTVTAFTQSKPRLLDDPRAQKGVRVVAQPDLRWARRDIKTTQLLSAVMAKGMAREQGVDDVWFVENGLVTEGTSNNTFIVVGDVLITRPISRELLRGITRQTLLACAADLGVTVQERPFSIDEAYAADEAFVTSASTFVTPVVEIDGARIGTGEPGSVTRALREAYITRALETSV